MLHSGYWCDSVALQMCCIVLLILSPLYVVQAKPAVGL